MLQCGEVSWRQKNTSLSGLTMSLLVLTVLVSSQPEECLQQPIVDLLPGHAEWLAAQALLEDMSVISRGRLSRRTPGGSLCANEALGKSAALSRTSGHGNCPSSRLIVWEKLSEE